MIKEYKIKRFRKCQRCKIVYKFGEVMFKTSPRTIEPTLPQSRHIICENCLIKYCNELIRFLIKRRFKPESLNELEEKIKGVLK